MRDFSGEFDLIAPLWGAPEPAIQRQLIEKLLSEEARIDFIIGNGVAAIEAAKLLQTMGLDDEIKVLSTYVSPPVREMIQQGHITAAPTDRGALLGALAVQLTIRHIEGDPASTPFRIAPNVILCTKEMLHLPTGAHC